MKKEYKILITVPASTARGGITNYYQVLRNEFSSNIEYFERGARTWPLRKGVITELIRAWKDFKAFKKRVKKDDISLVQTSTSLGFNSIIRDGLFLRFARKKGIKTIVFFRGWDLWAEKKTERYLWLFKYLFFKCSSILVLTQHTKNTLIKWGYKGDVFLETTLFDKNLASLVCPEFLSEKFNRLKSEKTISLLFLSRVEERKGIFELLEAYKSLKKQKCGYNYKLNICGDGSELEKIQNLVKTQEIPDVSIFGFVENQRKINAYQAAHIFIFPSYGEGMPNAVLEAMGFGLPVLTTRVGGVKDFFEPVKNGHFIEIKSSIYISDKILQMVNNPSDFLSMALNNFEKANKMFRSDIVAKRVEQIFESVIKTDNQ